jgi:phosphatidylglycerol:prolipoprotein diacylglycerol transferase
MSRSSASSAGSPERSCVLEHLGEEPATSLLLSRAGMSWFGGFAGGIGTALWMMKRRRWPVLPLLAAATPALAVGHAIGRIGCFLVGDDYGTSSSLPWAVAFPEGSPPTIERVHPTQLYEAAAVIPIAHLLVRWRRERASDARVLGAYFVLTGILRFAIEFIRVNDRVALGMTVAQWAALAIIVAGVGFMRRSGATGVQPAHTTPRDSADRQRARN